MKSISTKIVLNIVFFLTILSCNYNKEDLPLYDDETDNPNNGYFVKATIDGNSWTSPSFSGTLTTGSLNALIVIGTKSDGSTISISLNSDEPITTKKYTLAYAKYTVSYAETVNGTPTIYSSNYPDFTASPGDVTITVLNPTTKEVGGTFNFIGKNANGTIQKTVTSGTFKIVYQ